MKLKSLVGVIAAVLCSLFVGLSPAFGEGGNGYLALTVDCIKQNTDNTYTATFGYSNQYRDDGYIVITSEVGAETNFFSTGNFNRGQPRTFTYGRNPGVFTVTWDGTPLTWEVHFRIRGNEYYSTVTADINDAEQRACNIIPYADCIMRDYGRRDNGNWYEHYYTYFSYFNPGATVEVQQGNANAVGHYCYYNGCTPDLAQNQPTTFQSGHHRGVFRVSSLREGEYGNTYDLYWFLSQSEGVETYAASQWNYTRECNLYPVSECLEMGCKVQGQKGTKTAWFGYDNKEPFVIQTPTRNYYNGLRPGYGCEYNNYSGYDQFGRACIYPQPEVFQTGLHKKQFGVCFSGNYNSGEDGGNGEVLPIEEVGLNNYGYVTWYLGTGWYQYGNSHTSTITSQSKQCNRAPQCNAGSYTLPCAGSVTNLFLQGFLSTDPDADQLSYSWTHSCSGATLYGSDQSNAVLSLNSNGGSASLCSVQLTVKEQGTTEAFSSTCSGMVNVLSCELDNNNCRTRDMSSTEYMLSAAGDEQRRLIDRGVAFLRKINGQSAELTRFTKLAYGYTRKLQQYAFSYPDSVYECTTATSCASQSLSSTSNSYDTYSKKLDVLAKQLGIKINNTNQRSWAARYDRNRKMLRSNIVRLITSLPKQNNICK